MCRSTVVGALHTGLGGPGMKSLSCRFEPGASLFPLHCSVERSGSGVELRTLDYENPGSNSGCGVKTLGKFFHSTLLQFTQLFK